VVDSASHTFFSELLVHNILAANSAIRYGLGLYIRVSRVIYASFSQGFWHPVSDLDLELNFCTENWHTIYPCLGEWMFTLILVFLQLLFSSWVHVYCADKWLGKMH